MQTISDTLSILTTQHLSTEWLSIIHKKCLAGKLQATTTDDAITLIKWLHSYIDLCVPHLEKETSQYNELKMKSEQAIDKATKDQLIVSLSLRSFTVTHDASVEYEQLARLCLDIGRAFVRNTNTYLIGRMHSVFYRFGQTANSSYGGSIHKYVELKENLGAIVEEYSFSDN